VKVYLCEERLKRELESSYSQEKVQKEYSKNFKFF